MYFYTSPLGHPEYRMRFCVLGFYDLWVGVCCKIFMRSCVACMRFCALCSRIVICEAFSKNTVPVIISFFNWISGLIESISSVLFILVTRGEEPSSRGDNFEFIPVMF